MNFNDYPAVHELSALGYKTSSQSLLLPTPVNREIEIISRKAEATLAVGRILLWHSVGIILILRSKSFRIFAFSLLVSLAFNSSLKLLPALAYKRNTEREALKIDVEDGEDQEAVDALTSDDKEVESVESLKDRKPKSISRSVSTKHTGQLPTRGFVRVIENRMLQNPTNINANDSVSMQASIAVTFVDTKKRKEFSARDIGIISKGDTEASSRSSFRPQVSSAKVEYGRASIEMTNPGLRKPEGILLEENEEFQGQPSKEVESDSVNILATSSSQNSFQTSAESFIPAKPSMKFGLSRTIHFTGEITSICIGTLIILLFASTVNDSNIWSNHYITVDLVELLALRFPCMIALNVVAYAIIVYVESRWVGYNLMECIKEAKECSLPFASYAFFWFSASSVLAPFIFAETGLFYNSEAFLEGRI
ncbi:hypothetical protein HDU97_007942 [Phlyctochytrium planicorne]|nr:hypothetical protein HDU97_007942 [Phlyctochytrium planicorne]